MAFCPQCGASVEKNTAYCPQCGAKLAVESDDVRDNRSMAILSYIGPLCFVPYFKAKRSPFAHYHAVRGLNLFILEGVYALTKMLLTHIFSGVLGTLIGWLLCIGWGFFVYLSVMGVRHASQGKKKDLPLIGSIRFIKE